MFNEEKYIQVTNDFFNAIEKGESNGRKAIHCIWYLVACPRISVSEIAMIKKLYGRINPATNTYRYKLAILMNKADQVSVAERDKFISDIAQTMGDCPFLIGIFPIVCDRLFTSYISLPIPTHFTNTMTRTDPSPDPDFCFVNVFDLGTKETVVVQLSRTEGLDKVTEETMAVMDEVTKVSFVSAQFSSLKLKDMQAKQIIKKHIFNRTIEEKHIVKEIIALWRSHFNENSFQNDKAANGLMGRVMTFFRSMIGQKRTCDLLNLAVTGVATHDFFRSVVMNYWKLKDRGNFEIEYTTKGCNWVGWRERIQYWKEELSSAPEQEAQALARYLDEAIWNETSSTTLLTNG